MSSAISTEPVLGVFQQRVLVVVKLEKVVDDDDDDGDGDGDDQKGSWINVEQN